MALVSERNASLEEIVMALVRADQLPFDGYSCDSSIRQSIAVSIIGCQFNQWAIVGRGAFITSRDTPTRVISNPLLKS